MKLKYLMAVLLAAHSTACDDPRDENMPGPSVFLVQSGDRLVRIYDVEPTADVNVYAYCSGFEEKAASVAVRVSPEALAGYNEEHGTAYRLLDAKYYSLTAASQVIPASERRAAFPIRFDCAALTSLADMQRYCVPLELVSEGDVPVNGERSVVLVRPDLWKAEVVMTTSGKQEQTVPASQGGVIDYEVRFRTEFDNKKACRLELDCSPAVLEAYNRANGTLLKPFPEGAVVVDGEPELAAGVSELTLTIRVDLSKIAEKGVYTVPVRLVSTSCYAVSQTQNLALFRLIQAPQEVPEPLDRSRWQIVSCNSYQAADSFLKMIDGDPATLWEARYSAGGKFGVTKCPFETVWDFGELRPINGIGLLRRPEAKYVTDLKSGYLEVSADNVAWHRVGEFDYDKSETSPGPFGFYFEKTELRYLKLVVTGSNRSTSGYDAISVAELYTCQY